MGIGCAVPAGHFPGGAEPAPLPGGRKSAVSLVFEPGLCVFPSSQPSEPSLLLQYHESGLSSSSHELSQYIHDGADSYDPVLPGSWNVGQTGEVTWGALTRGKGGNKWLVVGYWLSLSWRGNCAGTRHDWGAAGWVNGLGVLPG